MALTKISRGLLSTGISDSSDATAITIDSSENILLSNTTSLIGVNTSDGSDNKSVMINGGGSASDSRGAYVWIKGNEHSDAGFLQLNAGNVSGAGIKFFTSGSESVEITSSGNLEIADGDLVVASGHGISFSATADSSGTMQNEQFDDYEEGTWTPTISGVASNNIDALTTVEGYYTKIGRMVYVSFHANCNPTSTGTAMVLGGLPYTVSDLIQNSGIEGTSAIFSDGSLFIVFPLSGGTTFAIELDRPMQGSASASAAAYRGSFFYPAAT